MSDSRDMIETNCLYAKAVPGQVWNVDGGYVEWPEVVAFAEAILAANEAWLDANTPTIEELRAKYPDIEAHNTLARRAEIGRLVEATCRNGSLDGPLKVFPSRLADGPVRVSLVTVSGVRNGEARTLLDALRALAGEIGGGDE